MQKNKDFYDFFDLFFLAKTRVWQKMVITMKTAIKNCVAIRFWCWNVAAGAFFSRKIMLFFVSDTTSASKERYAHAIPK